MVIDKIIFLASAIIIDKEKRILLLQRSDIGSFPSYWQLVEGKIDTDESPDEALQREIKEEIGVEIKELKLIPPVVSSTEAKGTMYLAIRILFKAKLSSSKIHLSHEHKAFAWYKKQEALALPLLPGLKEILDRIL